MKILNKDEANLLLKKVGFTIGYWDRFVDLDPDRKRRYGYWRVPRTPRDGLKLYCFSCCVAGWLPEGEWQMFQIDDSTGMLPLDQAAFVSRLIGADDGTEERRSLLFEPFEDSGWASYVDSSLLFESDPGGWAKANLTVAHLIYAFLLFEAHGCLVSSGSQPGEMIDVQDGLVYFISDEKRIAEAKKLVNLDSESPKLPSWMLGNDMNLL